MPFYTNNQKQSTMIETKFTLYRLRIESFMAGVPASESDSKMIAGFILKHLECVEGAGYCFSGW